jgi:hypothetical protein
MFFFFLIFIFGDHVLPFLFLSIIYIFFYFLFFLLLFFYLYQSILEKDKRERVSIRCFSMKNYTIVIFVLYLFIFPVTINIFNCLNEENKRFTNSLSLSLYYYFLLFSLAFSLYLNVRQLKRMSFIWNAFN